MSETNPVKHVVHFSAGIGSFWALNRTVQKYGAENVVVLSCDTLIEDDDLYRFLIDALAFIFAKPELRDELPLNIPVLDETEARRDYLVALGHRLMAAVPQFVYLCDGRTPWQVFEDERRIGSGLADLCSRILKRDLLDAWRKANTTPETATFYLGIDWTEAHRMFGSADKPGGMRAVFAPWESEAPMTWAPLWMKDRMASELVKLGIALPDLYKEGFPHNNCGGFCIKAGMAQFAHLWAKRPWLYNFHERHEERVRLTVGDYSVMKDRRGGGPRRTMTLRQFRERLEAGETFDRSDFGGICACSANPDDPSENNAVAAHDTDPTPLALCVRTSSS
jgi:hypothetical protein